MVSESLRHIIVKCLSEAETPVKKAFRILNSAKNARDQILLNMKAAEDYINNLGVYAESGQKKYFPKYLADLEKQRKVWERERKLLRNEESDILSAFSRIEAAIKLGMTEK